MLVLQQEYQRNEATVYGKYILWPTDGDSI